MENNKPFVFYFIFTIKNKQGFLVTDNVSDFLLQR